MDLKVIIYPSVMAEPRLVSCGAPFERSAFIDGLALYIELQLSGGVCDYE
jgi:hypothetical protein